MLCGGVIAWAMDEQHIIWLIVACLCAPVAVLVPMWRHHGGYHPAPRLASGPLAVPHKKLVWGVIGSAAFIQASHAVLYAYASLQWRAMGIFAQCDWVFLGFGCGH